MWTFVQRAALIGLVVAAGSVGPWALVAPRSFYEAFPGAGHAWVAVDGPFNEHLVRDVGALYCALLALTVLALMRPDRVLVRATGLVWLVFGLPHLGYHLAHLNVLVAADRPRIALTLGLSVVAAAALCLPGRPERAGARGRTQAVAGEDSGAIAGPRQVR